MNISVHHIEIIGSESNEIKLYELQVENTCTILELNYITLSQYNINVSSDRFKLIYGGLYLHDLNGNNKLSDHSI